MWPRLLPLLVAILSAALARADGIVLPGSINTRVQIPDQQALIHFQDGAETLVVETCFTGPGSDFAWIVPVPSMPEVSAVTNGLFPTLRAALRPRLGSTELLKPITGLLVLGTLFVLARRLGAPWSGLLLGLLLCGCILSLFLPALARARGVDTRGVAITVLDRAYVGSFDTVTITGPDGGPLVSWLRANGYAVPDEARPIIDDYAKRGWVFVASRLRRDSSSHSAAAPHPLAFKFRSNEPVYPLRLTALASHALSLDLYVFGEERAAVPGLAVVTSCSPQYTEPQVGISRSIAAATGVEFSHSEVRRLVGKAGHATLLRGTLGPEQMRADVVIQWDGHTPYWTTLWSGESAAWIAAVIGMSVLFMGLIIADIKSAVQTAPAKARSPRAQWCGGAGLAAAGLAWLLVPTVPVEAWHGRFQTALALHQAIMSLGDDIGSELHANGNGRITADWARSRILSAMEEPDAPAECRRVIDEDSPGNFTVQRTASALDVRTYDEAGREFVTELDVPPAIHSTEAQPSRR